MFLQRTLFVIHTFFFVRYQIFIQSFLFYVRYWMIRKTMFLIQAKIHRFFPNAPLFLGVSFALSTFSPFSQLRVNVKFREYEFAEFRIKIEGRTLMSDATFWPRESFDLPLHQRVLRIGGGWIYIVYINRLG